jgi:hypothetical protein
MLADRKRGLWNSKDTRDDMFHCLTQAEDSDIAITMFRSKHCVAYLNLKELLCVEVPNWKSRGCVSHDYNIREFQFGGKTYYTFVIQDPKWTDANAPMCPLMSITGMMVSGFTYIVARREIAELVGRKLNTA